MSLTYEDKTSIFHYKPNFMNEDEQKDIFDYLENTCNFIPSPQYTNSISRYQKWYNTDKKYFCPLWKQRFPQWESFEMDEMITSLINKMQKILEEVGDKTIINSCLINKYPDGKHFISPHRDSP